MTTKTLLYTIGGGATIIGGASAGIIVAANHLKKEKTETTTVEKNANLELATNFAKNLESKDRSDIADFIHASEATKGKTVIAPQRYQDIFDIASLNPKEGFNVSEMSRYDQLLKMSYILKYNDYKVIPSGNKVYIALSGTTNSTEVKSTTRKLIQHGNHFHEVPDDYEAPIASEEDKEINFLDYHSLADNFSPEEVVWLQNGFFNNGVFQLSFDDNTLDEITFKSTDSKYGKLDIDFSSNTTGNGKGYADFVRNVMTGHMTVDESYISITNMDQIDSDQLGHFIKHNADKVKKIVIGDKSFGLTKDNGNGLPGLVPTSGSLQDWKDSMPGADEVKFNIAKMYLMMNDVDINDLSKSFDYDGEEVTDALKEVIVSISKSSDTWNWENNYNVSVAPFALKDPYSDGPASNTEADYGTWVAQTDANNKIATAKLEETIGISIDSITFGGEELDPAITKLIDNKIFWEQVSSGGVHEFINSLAMVLAADEDLAEKFVEEVYVLPKGKITMNAGHMHPGDSFDGFSSSIIDDIKVDGKTTGAHEIYVAQDNKRYFTNLNTLQTGFASLLRSLKDFSAGNGMGGSGTVIRAATTPAPAAPTTIAVGDTFDHTIKNFLGTNKDFVISYTVVDEGTNIKGFTLDPNKFIARTETNDHYNFDVTKEIFTTKLQMNEYVDAFLKEYTW